MGVIMSNEVRPGTFLELDNVLYCTVEYNHIKPGKGTAFVRLKLRNIRQGTVVERTLNTDQKLSVPDIEEKNFQFLYQQGDEFVFMDQDTYEQLHLSRKIMSDHAQWLKEEMVVQMLMHNGEPLDIRLPFKVELRVTSTEPCVRGNTVSGNVTKEAILETGAKVQVPMFVDNGTLIRVDTRTGDYIERV